MNARELAMRGASLPFRATGAVVNKGLLSPLARISRIPLRKAAKNRYSGKTYNLKSGPGIFNPAHVEGFDHRLTVNKFRPTPSMTLGKGYQPLGRGFDLSLSHDITPRWTDMNRRTEALKKYDEGLLQAPSPPEPRPTAAVQRPKVTPDYFVEPYKTPELKRRR